MWTIKHIFDGDYGCEELRPGEFPQVTVTLINEYGEEKTTRVTDIMLTENNLDVGSEWPRDWIWIEDILNTNLDDGPTSVYRNGKVYKMNKSNKGVLGLFKSKAEKELDAIINRLEMNMSNNYKDNAQANLKEFEAALEAMRNTGMVKTATLSKYEQTMKEYKVKMQGYSHKDQKPYWT